MEHAYKPSGGYHFAFPDDILEQQQQHPLLKGLFVCRAGYFPTFSGHFAKRVAGFNKSHILIYCTAGKGWFESEGKRWTITQGQLFFVLATMPHAYGADEADPWTIHWLHFDGEETAVFLHHLNITQESPVLDIGEQLAIVRLFNQINDLCQLGYSITFLINCAALLRQILSNIALQNTLISPNAKGLDIEQTIQFMRHNLAQNYTVQEFASQANLSQSHFSRLFHAKTGYAPHDYFIRLKMQKAATLLVTSTLLVRQISQALGYEDAYYFSRLFKKIAGLSPREYRRKRGGGV